MKKCTKCHEVKEDTEFHFRNNLKGTRRNTCKTCHSDYLRAHYLLKTSMYRKNGDKQRKKLREENYEKQMEYLKNHPCVDCNESDPVVLHFDHVRGKKAANISWMLNGQNWSKVEDEIKKCVVRCANCHLRKTAKQFSWRKSNGV